VSTYGIQRGVGWYVRYAHPQTSGTIVQNTPTMPPATRRVR